MTLAPDPKLKAGAANDHFLDGEGFSSANLAYFRDQVAQHVKDERLRSMFSSCFDVIEHLRDLRDAACSSCAGDGKALDGGPCICGGAGTETAEIAGLRLEVHRLRALINTPRVDSFLDAVRVEAAHQVERWGSAHDQGKTPADWFWLLGWLAGKAVHAATHGDREKALHHTISSAACLLNWHARLSGEDTGMRPGIADPEVTRG